NGTGRRLVVCVPDGLPQDGVVGRRDLSSRHLGGVQPAWHPRCVIGGVVYARKLWSHYAHLLLGKGMSRAAVFGHQYGRHRGGISRVLKAISDRDLFL